MSSLRLLRIGVIADTHGLFDPIFPKTFRHIDHSLLGRIDLKIVLC
jgi:hypothetical protein